MCTGHKVSGYGINSQVLDRYLKNADISRELHSHREINRKFSIPYLGGYSNDGKTIYFDSSLPQEIELVRDGTRRRIDPTPFLLRHEALEKTLIDQLGLSYSRAHMIALAYERRGVLEQIGPGWWDAYQQALKPYIKADEQEKIKKVPKDLDLTPYKQQPVDEKLLKKMESLTGQKSKD